MSLYSNKSEIRSIPCAQRRAQRIRRPQLRALRLYLLITWHSRYLRKQQDSKLQWPSKAGLTELLLGCMRLINGQILERAPQNAPAM